MSRRHTPSGLAGDESSGRRTILVVNPSADLYGSDRMTLEAVRGLLAHGWEVVVTVSCDGPLVPVVEDAGARVVVCPAPVLRKSNLSATGLLRLGAAAAASVRPMVGLIRSVDPSVVYVNTLSVPLWLVLARVMGIPSVLHVHEAETSVPRLARRALALPGRLAQTTIYNSETSRAAAPAVGPRSRRRIRVVHNGVRFPEATSPSRRAVDQPRLAYIGRLSPRKGVDVVVAAVAELHRRGVQAHLEIVGSTFPGYEWYEAQLRELVETSGLSDVVTFTGFVADVAPVLARADILVVPSRAEESFGNVVIEATIAGRPVIASDHSGLHEAMSQLATAFPIPVDDPPALADAVQTAMRQWSSLRETALADAPRIRETYAPGAFHEKVASVVREVSSAPRRLWGHPSSRMRPVT